jgi:hypothetical protein
MKNTYFQDMTHFTEKYVKKNETFYSNRTSLHKTQQVVKNILHITVHFNYDGALTN